MRWVAPSEKDTANQTLEKRLWAAADQFRANSGLKAGQYSTPVLGLIFLRFAEARFAKRRAELEKANAKMLLGIRGVLTPDQWTKLQSQERENRRMMMQRFGRSGDRGEPHGPDSHGEAPLPPPAP